MQKNIHTFIACEGEYNDAQTVIFGAPFDATASYRPGARFAGQVIRTQSMGIETYSPYLNRDLQDICVFDGGDLDLPISNAARVLDIIEAYVSQIVADKKIPCMIGGEHLVTLGAVRALAKAYPQMRIIHFDAHADLRHDYLGEQLSHATVMRRCFEILGNDKIFQFGIRSGDREEFLFADGRVCMNKFGFGGLDSAVNNLKGMPVYFTLDLDIIDPSEFPGTGTPEAGGVSFLELLAAVSKVMSLNIIGCDINEFSPIYDPGGISAALACKLIREILLQI